MGYHQNPISFIYTFYFKHELPAPVLGLVVINIHTYHLVYLFIMRKQRNDRNNFWQYYVISNLLGCNEGDTGKVEFVDTSAINANVRQGTPDLLPMTI